MPSADDVALAEIVVRQGLCTREKVDECLALLESLAARGAPATLGELMVRKGYLSGHQLAETMRTPSTAGTAAAATKPAAVQGEPFGRYIKTNKLGAGGMGEVWKAFDPQLGRWVALKFLKHDDPGEVTRFLREAQTAAQLSHPNIGAVYEAGTVDGRAFIAMQFIRGQTLASHPRKDPRRLVTLMRDAAAAVHYANQSGVIHRDLKPLNLMVEGDRVYVMDFGLAARTDVKSSLSVSGMMVGTPAYMSPEQAMGKRADARSDVYSLGATLYELLGDRPPFEGSLLEILQQAVGEDAIPVRRRNPRIDADLDTVVMKCLEKDPAMRYATAGDLAADLTRWLDGDAIVAHPPSAMYRVRKFLSRRKALSAAVAASLVAVVLAAVFVPQWLRDRAEKERLRKEKERDVAAERERARETELALKELGALWTQVLLAKQGLHRPSEEPERVRAKLTEAVSRLDEYIRRHPDHPQGYYVRARGWIYLEELEAAERDLREAVRLNAEFSPGQALLSRLLLDQYRRALYGPRETERWRMTTYEPLLTEARQRLELGWREEAASVEKWGLAKTPEDEVGEVLTRACVLYMLKGDAAGARQLLKEADQRERSEEYCNQLAAWTRDGAAAIELQSEAIRRMAHYAKAYLDRAGLHDQLGRAEPAIADYTQALRIQPRLHAAYVNRGRLLLFARADVRGAIDDFTRAIELRPDHWSAYNSRAGALVQAGQHAAALDDFERALKRGPTPPHVLLNRARTRHLIGDYDGALSDMEILLRGDPDHAEALMHRGLARYRKGDRKSGLADIDRSIELHPDAEALVARSMIRLEQGNPRGAKADLDEAVKLAPADGRALTARGLFLEQAGDRKGARRDYDAAIKAEPALYIAYRNRGLLRQAERDYAGAHDDFAKCLEIEPANPEGWALRGTIREGISGFDKSKRRELLELAEADFAKAVAVAKPSWADLDQAKQVLAFIRKELAALK